MAATPVPATRHWPTAIKAALALLAALMAGSPILAQDTPAPLATLHFGEVNPVLAPPSPPPLPPLVPVANKIDMTGLPIVPVVDSGAKAARPSGENEDGDLFPVSGNDILQTSCPGCGDMPPPDYPPPGSAVPGPGPGPKLRDTLFWGCLNCGVGACRPGAKDCYPCCNTDTACERFFCNLYHCICCPDPCYEGKWQPIADSAFFTEGARPVSQTRLRWEHGADLILPDRSEYFWARADGQGRGPKPTAPFIAESRVTYNDLSMYTEIATGMFSFIIEMPYRSIDPDIAPHAAGFGDMNIATKTLIFDCELLQVAMMMRTYMPVGNAGKGIGNGHVSLEPSLIVGIKLHQDAHFQGQIAEWIPLGGDQLYAGAILHYHISFNQVLCRIVPNVPLIGTLEAGGYSFQDGAYTDPVFGPFQQSSGTTYGYLGGGLRLFVCDRIDFGAGFQTALTRQHFADQVYRMDFRFRY